MDKDSFMLDKDDSRQIAGSMAAPPLRHPADSNGEFPLVLRWPYVISTSVMGPTSRGSDLEMPAGAKQWSSRAVPEGGQRTGQQCSGALACPTPTPAQDTLA